MLTQERHQYILKALDEKKAVTVADLTKELNTSESTIRRDLNTLAKQGKLNKVHGGATYVELQNSVTHEQQVELRRRIRSSKKDMIGRYAASLIEPEDFVYIDAGTTTGSMISYLTETNAIYMTNSMEIASKLVRRGFETYTVGGRIRQITEAIVGSQAEHSIEDFHFSKGFFGVNGISLDADYSTPDIEEARIKRLAMSKSYKAYVLSDSSKFSVNSSVTFGKIEDATIITDKLPDKIYREHTIVIEVE
ncbi:MAG: DeoR/GlpR family DNA-binding transcription regulator [Lachnospiraceae bacterium]|nr:DeoR/GlpR family DNA-binding transcription regulator [Lachnospiraceae bacterium]